MNRLLLTYPAATDLDIFEWTSDTLLYCVDASWGSDAIDTWAQWFFALCTLPLIPLELLGFALRYLSCSHEAHYDKSLKPPSPPPAPAPAPIETPPLPTPTADRLRSQVLECNETDLELALALMREFLKLATDDLTMLKWVNTLNLLKERFYDPNLHLIFIENMTDYQRDFPLIKEWVKIFERMSRS